MTETFEVLLPVPPTANNLFPTGSHGKRFPSKKYKEWKEEASRTFQSQHNGVNKFHGRLNATYSFGFTDKRRRDLANYEKATTDFLQSMGVFEDDSQIDRMVLVRLKEGNGVYVQIFEMGAA